MKGLFSRRWRNGHEGCAWCSEPSIHFDIDRKGEKVGACKKHKGELTAIRNERQGALINEALARDRRIDHALWKKGRKR